jgi:lysozyme family protein
MTTVDTIIKNTISLEGGYIDNPYDRGGPTNYGITIKTLANYLGRAVTKDEVRNLNKDLAYEIYEKNYFVYPRINTLPENLQVQIFDISVNCGPRTAIRLLQNVLNKAGFGPVDEDGVLGPQTRQACVEAYESMGNYLINAIVDERIIFYNQIVEKNPSQSVFLTGWTKRAESFRV